MEIEKQVCSLELAKRLKELGVKQESYFYWKWHNDGVRFYLQSGISSRAKPEDFYSAYTVAELGEMLPNDIFSGKDNEKENEINSYYCTMTGDDGENGIWDNLYNEGTIDDYAVFHAETEADARAKMLIYLLENNLVKL